MSGADYLNTITENASRLGMRLQESLSEHTREFSLNRSDFDLADDKSRDIRKQLDSSSDKEKLNAMKRLIALISKGRNVSEYFAQVVKNVASHNLQVRKLVYIYLLRYAEHEPDLALLSINTFQKDLTDSNPFIRAMALRVLSGIKVPMIANIVLLAIKKCAADISPYVRKVAASAIPECYALDSSLLPSLIEIITTLLRDRSPLSIGNVIVAFEAICPTRLDLIHQHYRRFCRILVDADEWGQVDLLNLLLRYAHTMLPRPGNEVDKDITLLLTSSEPLLMSRNPATVLAAARVIYYAGPSSYHSKVVRPLLRLLHTSPEVERVVLAYILIICRMSPTLFSDFYSRFFLRSDDLRAVKLDKIAILLCITSNDNRQAILRELIDYSDDTDNEIVAVAIKGIGRCARLFPDCRPQCLSALINMIKNSTDMVVSCAVVVLKSLIQAQLSIPADTPVSSPSSPLAIIAHLARRIDDIRHPEARACVVWLVGQYAASAEKTQGPEGIVEWSPDVLRKTAKSFRQETPEVKLQIITLAGKLFVLSPSDRTLALLNQYVLSLARYDINYDVRDRARMLSSLLVGVVPNADVEDRGGVVLRREQVRLVLFEGKKVTQDADVPTAIHPTERLGSLEVVTGKPMHTDTILPDWLEKGVESSLRDTDEDLQPKSAVTPATVISSAQSQRVRGSASPVVLTPGDSPAGSIVKAAWTDLDKFYEESSSEEGTKDEEGSDDEGDEDVGDEDDEDEENNDEVDQDAEEEESESESPSEKEEVKTEIQQHR